MTSGHAPFPPAIRWSYHGDAASARATERAFPGLWSGIMCRKRSIDEALIASSREIDAAVDLGAGFDSRE